MKVLAVSYHQLLVEGKLIDISELCAKTKEFITNPTNSDQLSDKKAKDIPLFGEVMVSKGIISLRNDNSTTYETYIAIQNELARAYNQLRDELANKQFGREYAALNSEQKAAVKKIYPQRISEAEPKDVNND